MIVVYTYREDYAGKDEYPLPLACLIASLVFLITGACK